MTLVQNGGRPSVVDASAHELREPRPTLVEHSRGGLVAALPSGVGEAPNQVNILADVERFVEAVDLLERRRSHHKGGGRNVGDAGAGADRGRIGAEVERRRRRLVPVDDGGAGGMHDSWRDQAALWSTEVHQECIPALQSDEHIGIDERNEVRNRIQRSPPGHARRRRSTRYLAAHQ